MFDRRRYHADIEQRRLVERGTFRVVHVTADQRLRGFGSKDSESYTRQRFLFYYHYLHQPSTYIYLHHPKLHLITPTSHLRGPRSPTSTADTIRIAQERQTTDRGHPEINGRVSGDGVLMVKRLHHGSRMLKPYW